VPDFLAAVPTELIGLGPRDREPGVYLAGVNVESTLAAVVESGGLVVIAMIALLAGHQILV
jgi:hypothetical protein